MEAFNLSPFSDLTQLTRVALEGPCLAYDYNLWEGFIQPLVQLHSLPASVLDLELERTFAEPATFPGLSCTGLTRLSLDPCPNEVSHVTELLSHLPNLKVILVKQES